MSTFKTTIYYHIVDHGDGSYGLKLFNTMEEAEATFEWELDEYGQACQDSQGAYDLEFDIETGKLLNPDTVKGEDW